MSPLPSPLGSAAPPRFLVGRDAEGRWLALEAEGRGGGIFRSREAAWRYARGETGGRPGAVTLSSQALALTL
jgi:hypothetical protein